MDICKFQGGPLNKKNIYACHKIKITVHVNKRQRMRRPCYFGEYFGVDRKDVSWKPVSPSRDKCEASEVAVAETFINRSNQSFDSEFAAEAFNQDIIRDRSVSFEASIFTSFIVRVEAAQACYQKTLVKGMIHVQPRPDC